MDAGQPVARRPGPAVGPAPRQLELLGCPRWAWLGPFVARWYADPMSAADAAPTADLADAEQRYGRPLPPSLREWFELVGARLRDVQDSPATPASVDDGPELAVWRENQGVWRLLVDADDRVHVDDPDFTFPTVPTATALAAMLVSDTLVGAWSGDGDGPLGRLGAHVRGGVVEDITAELLARSHAAYADLDVPGNPFLPAPPFGDSVTLLRGDPAWGMGLEWATATDDAYAAWTAVRAAGEGPQRIFDAPE